MMGFAYHANYFRWFETARTEFFRNAGLAYKTLEARGVRLPVSEAYCRFTTPVAYDDILIIETVLDPAVRSLLKFDYRIVSDKDPSVIVAAGYTRHPCLNPEGRVIRPPAFLRELMATLSKQDSE